MLDCLEIENIIIAQNTDKEIDEHDFTEVPSFVLNSKGYSAAEGYLEARFHLYSNVYLHKTTRAAEKMLGALLFLLSKAIKDRGIEAMGLQAGYPLLQYIAAENPSLAQYLALDDTSVWSLLPALEGAPDARIAALAGRLLRRDLFKCVDIGVRLSNTGSDEKVRFQRALTDLLKNERPEPSTVMSDEPRVTGYDWYSWGDESALKKVLIRDREQNKNFDIGDRSDVVKALRQRQFFRIYVPDRDWQQRLETLWEEIGR